MILLGQPVCDVIYYQLQGHLAIVFNVLFGRLLYFWTNGRCILLVWIPPYIHVRQIERNYGVPIPYLENSNSSIAGEDSEGANCLFSRCKKRYFVAEMVWLPIVLDCWSIVQYFFVLRPFSTNKVTNKNRLFCNPKGTRYSRHCLFKFRKIADWRKKAGELS